MVNIVFDSLISLVKSIDAAVILLAVTPMAESRLAIAVAIKYGFTPFKAFLLGFLGSSIAAVFVLFFALKLIKLVSKAKIFKKLIDSILLSAEEKAKKLNTSKTSDKKKMLGIFCFTALPLPLTGVYMGSLIALVIGLKYPKAILSILAGNFLSCVIITVTGVYFSEYINIMVTVLTVLAILTLIFLLIKAFCPKKLRKTKNLD